MNWPDLPKPLRFLAYPIAAILFMGAITSGSIVVSTVSNSDLKERELCIRTECVKRFAEANDQAFILLKACFDISAAIATTGGIFVALLGYLTAAKNGALVNHIEHLKLFSEFLHAEVAKRDRLKRESFDALLLYNYIFSKSHTGDMDVSDQYVNFIREVNMLIDDANKVRTSGVRGGFDYGKHQRAVSSLFKNVGIAVYSAPRNDYFEMEEQLFALLHRISQSFCRPGLVPALIARNYR